MKRGAPLQRRTPLRRSNTPLKTNKPLQRKTPLAPRSKKREAQERVYRIMRDDWLPDQVCCVCGSETPDTVQHLAGRRGLRLNDRRYWRAMCWEPCHRSVEANPADANERGFRLTRVWALPDDEQVSA